MFDEETIEAGSDAVETTPEVAPEPEAEAEVV